jgi:hypothetical protein
MAWRKLAEQQWEAIRVRLPQVKVSAGDARVLRIDAALKASSGFCGLVSNGATCPAGMAVPVPAGAGSNIGKRRACCSRCGGLVWPNSTTSKRAGGMNAVPLGFLCLRQRGT